MTEHPDPITKWKNMRRMAWLCVWSGVLYPVSLYFVDDGKSISDVAIPFYLFVGSVVGAYMGFSTWGDKK
jgi:hypothetical protein